MRGYAIALAGALLASLFTVSAVGATQPPDHKVTICHALPASASHDYNRITVDIASSGYVKGGHHRPVIHPAVDDWFIGVKHSRGGDIIPPYTYGDTVYPGQNWTTVGQAIYRNGCRIPSPPNGKFDPRASIAVCGDPRIKTWMDNTRSTVKAQYRIRFIAGVDGNPRVVIKNVAPGASKSTAWRWVKGGGSWFSVKVRPYGSGISWGNAERLVGKRIWRGDPWGTGRCIK